MNLESLVSVMNASNPILGSVATVPAGTTPLLSGLSQATCQQQHHRQQEQQRRRMASGTANSGRRVVEDQLQESPFDNVLRTNDFNRAVNMLSSDYIVNSYPPRITLDQYMSGRRGDDGFSETLVHLIQHKIYRISVNFMNHIMKHFSPINVLKILNAVDPNNMTIIRNEATNTLLHTACMRNNLDIIRCLVGMGFDFEHRDSKNQTPIFHLIQGQCVCLFLSLVYCPSLLPSCNSCD